jgi:hypothetical protein
MQPSLPQPPFGAPPPGMNPAGGYYPPPQQPMAQPMVAPAMHQPMAQPMVAPAMQQPMALPGQMPAGPYGPAPAMPAPQPAMPAGRCDLGHDVPAGSSYCSFGHPIALGDIKFAHGDPFGSTAFPEGLAGAQAPLPPTGAMSPFPQQAPPQPPVQSGYGLGQQAAPQAPVYGQAVPVAPVQPAPQPVAWQPSAQPAPYDPMAATSPAGQARRMLRGFVFSFHADNAGIYWPLYMGRNPIGRAGSGEAVEIEIADPTTSSRHACFVCDAVSIVLEDEGSTNGTFVNDQPLGYRGRQELRDGDRIRFGAYNTAIRFVTR